MHYKQCRVFQHWSIIGHRKSGKSVHSSLQNTGVKHIANFNCVLSAIDAGLSSRKINCDYSKADITGKFKISNHFDSTNVFQFKLVTVLFW